MADERLEAELAVQGGTDRAFVEGAFRLVLRRDPDLEALERALAKLEEGTLSRAALIRELATSEEFGRVQELDDAVALGLGARERGGRGAEPDDAGAAGPGRGGGGGANRWLQAPAQTDGRVGEGPWVLSRLRSAGRVLEVGYAFAETAYLGALLRSGVEVVGADLAT